MVHADASNFDRDVSKQEAYTQVLEQAKALFEGQRNWVCNLANAASLLWHAYHSLPAPSNHVNWAGFYVLDHNPPPEERRLILGPFHGKVACQTINVTPCPRGVCGVAAASGQTQRVRDVAAFPGHIACDAESASEIVVPIKRPGTHEVVGIIDIDCAVVDGFDDTDKYALEALAALLGKSCDW